MSKTDKQLLLRSLGDTLLVSALEHIAFTLKPYPKSVSPEEIASAMDGLRKRGFVHGDSRTPNLTGDGIDAARRIVGKE